VRHFAFNADFEYNEGEMAQLTVRNIPDDLVKALRVRAAQNGRSAEAEHRLILAEAVRTAAAEDFWTRADSLRRTTKPQRTESGRLQREMRDKR
jgi:plasmid stability protein